MNDWERAEQIFESRVFTDGRGQSLNYRLLEPLDFTPETTYPLVLFMHGAGQIGDDNHLQLEHAVRIFATDAVRAKYPSFVAAPQCPKGNKWVDTAWTLPAHQQAAEPTRPLSLVIPLVEALRQEFKIDGDRIHLIGISMGGFAVWEMAARWPDLWASLVPICGGGDESQASRFAQVPLWAIHGALDALVLPERSRNMIEALRKGDSQARYTEYPFVEHFAWVPALEEGSVIDWMFQQKRPEA